MEGLLTLNGLDLDHSINEDIQMKQPLESKLGNILIMYRKITQGRNMPGLYLAFVDPTTCPQLWQMLQKACGGTTDAQKPTMTP